MPPISPNALRWRGTLSRRDFLRLAAGTALAAPLVGLPSVTVATPRSRAAFLTTLGRTLERGRKVGDGTVGAYRRLRYGPGERHVRRLDLAPDAPPAPPIQCVRRALHFAHFTDMQIADAQSPARVEFLDRFSDQECSGIPFGPAFRPQETLTLQSFELMVRTINRIGSSPLTREPIQFAMCTGDNIDNEQFNELRWFIDLMDGGRVAANSGDPDAFEGVQAGGWGLADYWHPDAVDFADKYKEQYAFPDYPGLLDRAIRPFRAEGVDFPWFSCFGNHDGLMQGNAPQNPAFEGIAVGPAKVLGPPPGLNPCDHLETLGPEAFAGPGRAVTADPGRRILTRKEYVVEHFNTRGRPRGHGFTTKNRETGTAYYVHDGYPAVRMIVLDTTNPGGFSEGSIGAAQFAWLEQRLVEVHSRHYNEDGNRVRTGNRDGLVVLFGHHGFNTLRNPVIVADPLTPEQNDLPRVLGPEIEELLHRFPNLVLYVVGHTHTNEIFARPDPAGLTGGFWEVTSSAIVDWPCQSRLIELVDNRNGTLSVFCTVVDHLGPAAPNLARGLTRLASIQREVASNDPHYGIDGGASGAREDRNVELVIPAPFRL